MQFLTRCVLLSLVALIASRLVLASDNKIQPSTDVMFYYNDDVLGDRSLKNLTNFSFFSRFPAYSPSQATKLKEIIAKELKREGKVIQRSLFSKTSQGEVLDYSNFPNTEGSIIYQISQLVDLNGNTLPVIFASMKVSCQTSIDERNEKIPAIIWSRVYYLAGNLNSSSESLIKLTLSLLLKDFAASYTLSNPTTSQKLCFYLLD